MLFICHKPSILLPLVFTCIPGARTAANRQATRGKRQLEIESFYDLDKDEKIACLRNFDSVQWNKQLVGSLSNEVVTVLRQQANKNTVKVTKIQASIILDGSGYVYKMCQYIMTHIISPSGSM